MRWVMTMLGAGLLACGGSDPAAETSMDTSAGSGGGSSTPAVVSAGGSASSEMASAGSNGPVCTAPAPEVLLEGNLKGLAVRGDAVYFIDADGGPVKGSGANATPSGVVQRLDLGSRAVTTLYTPLQDERIVDFAPWDDALVLLLQGPVGLTFDLYLVPAAGGERQKIGPADGLDLVELGYGLLGTSGDEIFFHNSSSGTLSAFSRTGAPPRTLVEDVGLRVAFQLVGSRLWYSPDEGVTAAGVQTTLYSRDLASGSTPVEVYPDGCSAFGDSNIRFQVTDAGIVCGSPQEVTLLALDGSGSTAVVDVPRVPTRARSVLAAHTDGSSVYFAGSVFGLEFELGSKQTSVYTCNPVAVDTIGTNANSVIWGRTTGDGLRAGSVQTGRTSFDAILRLAK